MLNEVTLQLLLIPFKRALKPQVTGALVLGDWFVALELTCTGLCFISNSTDNVTNNPILEKTVAATQF